MKRVLSFPIIACTAAFCFFSSQGHALEKRDISSKVKALIVYHFDEPDIKKKLGVDFGSWELHPSYLTEVEIVKPTDEKEAEEFGNILRVSYDVSIAPEDLPYANYPVFNGVWFHLADADLSDYDTLIFDVRGDADAGFTRRFKVELKTNSGEVAKFYVNDIGYSWRRVEIPVAMIKTTNGKQLKSLKSMKEMTIVFEKEEVTNKKGILYFDNIYFTGPKDGIPKKDVTEPVTPPGNSAVKKHDKKKK